MCRVFVLFFHHIPLAHFIPEYILSPLTILYSFGSYANKIPLVAQPSQVQCYFEIYFRITPKIPLIKLLNLTTHSYTYLAH
jgi:hypothetical protein